MLLLWWRHIAVTVAESISIVPCQFLNRFQRYRPIRGYEFQQNTDVHEYGELADPQLYCCSALHVNHSWTAAVSHPFFCLINGPDTRPWPSSCVNAKWTISSIKYLLTLPLLLGSNPGPLWQSIKEIHSHWVMAFFSTFISGWRWIVGELRCIGIPDGECKTRSMRKSADDRRKWQSFPMGDSRPM